MKLRLVLSLVSLIIVSDIPVLRAQDSKLLDTIVIDRGALLNFIPEEAAFIVTFDNRVTARVPAMILAPLRKDPTSVNAGMWWFGAQVRVPVGSTTVSSFGVVLGHESQIEELQPETIDLRSGQHFNGSTDKLREYLLQRKSALGTVRGELKDLNLALARLRSDAEVIGNFGKIIDLKEELLRVKRECDGIDKDTQALEHFISLANTSEIPRNALGREQQLTGQIAELADAAKKAERGELGRRFGGEGDVQRRLAVLEESRGLDADDLRDELDRLTEERRELEEQVQ